MKPRRHQLAEETLAQLLQETGHSIQPSDLRDLLELADICNRIQNPEEHTPYDLLRLPVPLGDTGMHLRPVTIARSAWVAQYADTWPDELCEYAAVVYALSVDDSESLYTKPQSHHLKFVKAIGPKLDLPEGELERVLDKVMPPVEEGHDNQYEDIAASYGPLVAALCRMYSNTPHYYLHECPVETVQSLVEEMFRSKQDEAFQTASASGKVTTHPVKMQAQVQLRDKRKALLEKWSDADG